MREPEEEEDHDPLRLRGASASLPIDPDLDPSDPAAPSLAHRAGIHHHRSTHPVVLAEIAAGGFLGTLARYGVGRAWPTVPGHFPTGTFLINTSGAFLLGVILTLLVRRGPHAVGRLRPFFGTGLLGGWTTYSTFALGAVVLAKDGAQLTAVVYLAATLVCGTVAAIGGIALAFGVRR